MEISSEEIVSKLLAKNEILNGDKTFSYVSEPEYDLSDFLKNYKPEPSQYGEKYIFVK